MLVKGLSRVALAARQVGVNDAKVNQFAAEALFSTLTNVDFDPDRFVALIQECIALRDQLKAKVEAAGGKVIVPKRQISEEYGYMGLFIDSEGNRVAMHSQN